MTANTGKGSDFLQQLIDVGIFEQPENEPARLAGTGNSLPVAPITDPTVPVGELLPSQPKRRPFPILFKPQTQPSIFWKAFANTLVPLLSWSENLAQDDLAIFLTTPTQAGIPGGALAPDEIVNFQIYSKADALQILDKPGFSLDQGSYFSQLSTFMRCLVSDDDKPHIGEAREALLKATAAKDAAWRNALAKYEAIIQADPKFPPFQEFIKEDPLYNQAWEQEKQAQETYTSLQGQEMKAISQQIDILKLADDRVTSRKMSNMSCSAMSEDFVRRAMLNGNKKIVVDPADIFYRPVYTLPNWEMIVNHWSNDKVKPYRFPINFKGLTDVTWESMGHKQLDSAHAPKLNKEQKALIESLKGKVTFWGKPQVLDVERGLWDVKQLRQAGKLSKFAPDSVKDKFCKTTRLLLSWSYDIELTLPESIGSKSIEDINLSFLRVPVAEVSDDGRVLKFTTEQTNYPWLVAALATAV